MARTITAANSVFLLTIGSLFAAPQQLQGFATDDAFDDDGIDLAEVIMGVDGRMSAGYVPNPTKQTITLQADSPSVSIFEYWSGAIKAAREIIMAQGSITLPGSGRSYALVNGVLQNVKQFPGVKKTLQPQPFVIVWESILPQSSV